MHISSGVVELWTVKRGVFGFLDHSVYASAICYCKGPFTLSAERSGADTPEYARSVNVVIKYVLCGNQTPIVVDRLLYLVT